MEIGIQVMLQIWKSKKARNNGDTGNNGNNPLNWNTSNATSLFAGF